MPSNHMFDFIFVFNKSIPNDFDQIINICANSPMGDYDIAISNHSNVGLFDINKLGKQKNHYIDQKKNNYLVSTRYDK